MKKRAPSRSPSFRDGKVIPSDQQPEIIRELQGGSNTVLLAFSGKDSLAAWLYLKDHNFDVIPYWCYTVRGLSYDEQMLTYYENYFKTKIIRYPHFNMYLYLGNYEFQPPERVWVIDALGLADQEYDYRGIEEDLIAKLKLPPTTYTAQGLRSADNQQRARMVQQNGSIGVKRRYWWCVWDWNLDDCIKRIKAEGLMLPALYSIIGSTGDVWDYRVLKEIKTHYPKDFEKIKQVYPLIELEFFRYESVK